MSTDTETVSLPTLPTELLLTIADRLDQNDINSLVKTHRSLYRRLNGSLYRRDSGSRGSMHALFDASMKGCLRTVQMSIESFSEPKDWYSVQPGVAYWDRAQEKIHIALFHAANYGHADIVTFLLGQEGTDPNRICPASSFPLFSPLHSSSSSPILRKTPLVAAASEGHVAVVKALLASKDIRVNAASYLHTPALTRAAFLGHTEIVSLLLDHPGIDAKFVDWTGRTALLHTIERSRTSTTACFLHRKDLDIGINVGLNHGDDEGKTPLILACARRSIHSALPRLILTAPGVDVNARDKHNRTALFYAAGNGSIQHVGLLLKHQADPDPVDFDGLTPLLLAARSDSPGIVKMLLEAGADPNRKHEIFGTPLHAATVRQIWSVVAVLDPVTGYDHECDDSCFATYD